MLKFAVGMQFFATIDEPGWLQGPGNWLKPFLPIDPVTGKADDRHVQDYVAMVKVIHARQCMRLRVYKEQIEAGAKPKSKPSLPASLDQLYDNHRRAMNEVTKQQHMLTHPGCNNGANAADIRFWQGRIGGIGADPRQFTTAGNGNRPNDCLSGHISMLSWQNLVRREMLGHRTMLDGASAQSTDLVAKTNQPRNPSESRKAKNRLREQGICNGVQQSSAHPSTVYSMELDRFDNLFAATHGARPPERRHMTWLNTAFFDNMELSRGAVAAFNTRQAPSAPQIPMYPCHVHGLLWPEKMTKDRLIPRFLVRHADPRECILGSQARLLFMRVHAFGNTTFQGDRVDKGWHADQVFFLDQEPGHSVQQSQEELVYFHGHPRRVLDPRAMTNASRQMQHDVGEDFKGSRAKQERNNALANCQALGLISEHSSAHVHWKLLLQQGVYSNLNHVPMLVTQGHPAFGGDKNFYVLGRGQHPTWDYPMLVQHFFPASMFSIDPSTSWPELIRRMEDQNAADTRLHVQGRVEFAKRIHYPGGLRDCLLQDYALAEGKELGMTFACPWFQDSMRRLLSTPEGREQWQRFGAEVRYSHAFGMEFHHFATYCAGSLVMGQMQAQSYSMQQQTRVDMQELKAMMAQSMRLQQTTAEQVALGTKLLSPPKGRAAPRIMQDDEGSESSSGSMLALTMPAQQAPPPPPAPLALPMPAVSIPHAARESFVAVSQLPGDHWPDKPALLNRQGMGAHSKLHQQPHSGKRHGNVKIRLKTQSAWAKEPCKVCAQLGSLGRSKPRGHMQTIPDFAVLPLHVCLKTQ